jgi:hypothetical protein
VIRFAKSGAIETGLCVEGGVLENRSHLECGEPKVGVSEESGFGKIRPFTESGLRKISALGEADLLKTGRPRKPRSLEIEVLLIELALEEFSEILLLRSIWVVEHTIGLTFMVAIDGEPRPAWIAPRRDSGTTDSPVSHFGRRSCRHECLQQLDGIYAIVAKEAEKQLI